MLKLIILFCCLCISLCYYSIFNRKDKKDVEMAMEILKVIEENNIEKNSVNNLLDCSFVSNKIKLDVKTHLILGLNYSKYRRIDYGKYERP